MKPTKCLLGFGIFSFGTFTLELYIRMYRLVTKSIRCVSKVLGRDVPPEQLHCPSALILKVSESTREKLIRCFEVAE